MRPNSCQNGVPVRPSHGLACRAVEPLRNGRAKARCRLKPAPQCFSHALEVQPDPHLNITRRVVRIRRANTREVGAQTVKLTGCPIVIYSARNAPIQITGIVPVAARSGAEKGVPRVAGGSARPLVIRSSR